jgi:hypothetical protein
MIGLGSREEKKGPAPYPPDPYHPQNPAMTSPSPARLTFVEFNRSAQLPGEPMLRDETFASDLCADLVRPQLASLSGQHSTAGSQKNG